MNNTQNTHTMTFSNNPIIVAQVNAYITFLSCTNQNQPLREMFELVANDNRVELIKFLETAVNYHGQFTTCNEELGCAYMAKSLLNLIRMF